MREFEVLLKVLSVLLGENTSGQKQIIYDIVSEWFGLAIETIPLMEERDPVVRKRLEGRLSGKDNLKLLILLWFVMQYH